MVVGHDNNGQWHCVSHANGRSFLGYGSNEDEARVRCMELVRDYNLDTAKTGRILQEILSDG